MKWHLSEAGLVVEARRQEHVLEQVHQIAGLICHSLATHLHPDGRPSSLPSLGKHHCMGTHVFQPTLRAPPIPNTSAAAMAAVLHFDCKGKC